MGVPREIAGAAAVSPARVAMDLGAGLDCGPAWGTGWMAAPQAAPRDPALEGATVRLVVRPQLTGSEVRIRVSNAYGTAPLAIGAASVGRADAGRVLAGTLRPVTFDGQRGCRPRRRGPG